jgi:Spy/CpxP family protein refolding chaperone
MPLNSRVPDCGSKNLIVVPALAAMLVYFAYLPQVKADQEYRVQNSGGSGTFFVEEDSHRRHPGRDRLFAQAKEGEGESLPEEPGEGHFKGPPHGLPNDFPPPGPGGPGGFPRGGKPWEQFGHGPGPLDLTPLNLTPEQKQKIQEIRKQTGIKTRNLRKLLKEKRGAMRDAMFDPDVTEAQLRERHKEVTKLHQRTEQAMFDDFLSIRALLTAEQKKHLPEVKPPFREGPGAVGMRQGPGKLPLESRSKGPD